MLKIEITRLVSKNTQWLNLFSKSSVLSKERLKGDMIMAHDYPDRKKVADIWNFLYNGQRNNRIQWLKAEVSEVVTGNKTEC